jgi:RNA-directed DNA polymerase
MSPAPTPRYEWKTLPWRELERTVFKLQKRIFRAARRGEVKTVHRLQRLVMKSWAARCLAVRKVTQDNRGKRTAGVDGVKNLAPAQRLALATHLPIRPSGRAVRRVWIPKPGKPERRPLGIPTLQDRAAQTLVRLALEPEWEARFEPNAFGFRPGRSTHDAIEMLFTAICKKPKYVLDADIAACFNRIDHTALLARLATFPALRRAIRGWLRADVLDGSELFPTEAGTPQGGPLSPLLANVALHGLETAIGTAFPRARSVDGRVDWGWRPIVVRYADDFVVLHQDRDVIEQARQIAAQWLASVGLELKPEKTRIGHTLHPVAGRVGFDFLGFEVRQYPVGYHRSGKLRLGFKTHITPSTTSQRRHYAALAAIVRRHRAAAQPQVIGALNPLIRGWAAYYAGAVAKAAFNAMDHRLFGRLLRWGRRRHPGKSRAWVARRYWHTRGDNHWVFGVPEGVRLVTHTSTPIRRHVMVRRDASPYDGNRRYWATRLGRHPLLPPSTARLLKQQRGRCTWCGRYFTELGDLLERDHRIPRSSGGPDLLANRQLLHAHCHDQKTALDASGQPGPSQASMTRTDHRGAVCGETRTHGSEGERGAARPLA